VRERRLFNCETSVGRRADECRSDERDTLLVSRRATNESARDVRAADLQEETVKPTGDGFRFVTEWVSPDPTKTAATNEHRSERSEQ
jgi:hypothetical protein